MFVFIACESGGGEWAPDPMTGLWHDALANAIWLLWTLGCEANNGVRQAHEERGFVDLSVDVISALPGVARRCPIAATPQMMCERPAIPP